MEVRRTDKSWVERHDKELFIASIITLLIIHWFIIFKFAVNIPFYDDYDAVLDFLLQFNTAGNGDKLQTVFDQHGEHQILFTRVLVLIDYFIRGYVDFIDLIVIGNLVFLLLVWLMIKIFSRYVHDKWIFIVPALFALFNISSQENFLWAMASIQNYSVILLGILPIYLLFRQKEIKEVSFLISVILSTAATFSGGNGFLSFFVVFIGLIIAKAGKRLIIIWGLVFLLVFALYLLQYNTGDSSIFSMFRYPKTFAGFFLGFFGAVFENIYAAAIFGSLILVVYLIMVVKFFREVPERLMLHLLTLFVFLSICVITLGRGQLGIGHAVNTLHYRIYPELFIILLFLLAVSAKTMAYRVSRIVASVFLFICVLGYLFSLYHYLPRIKSHRSYLICGLGSYLSENKQCSLSYRPEYFDWAKRVLDSSISSGIYRPGLVGKFED